MSLADTVYALLLLVWGAALGALLALHFHPRHRPDKRPAHLYIVGEIMASVTEGAVFNFTVIATNKAGRVVPDTGITVTLDNAALGTATVADDGSGGVFTADGQEVSGNMIATDSGGLKSDPFPLAVTADNTPAALTITPA